MASSATVLKAKQNLAEIFGVDISGVSFESIGTDRVYARGLDGANIPQAKQFDLQRALTVLGGGEPEASFDGGKLTGVTFSHGDTDGTMNALANLGDAARSGLKGRIATMKKSGPGRSGGD